MANQPRKDNPNHNVRIADTLWARTKKRAAQDGTTPSEVVRQALEAYTMTTERTCNDDH